VTASRSIRPALPNCDGCDASGGNRRAEADAAHVAVKTEVLQLRLMEKRRELVRRDEVDALIDGIAGTVLTHLSGMSALFARHGGQAQHRRGDDADQARDQRGVQQDGRRMW